MTDGSVHPFETEVEKLYQSLIHEIDAVAGLPHHGARGARIETSLCALLQRVLPKKYSISTNQFVIDRTGKVSRECDIVIYNSSEHLSLIENYIPIELVYGVIEVKSKLNSTASKDFREKASDFWKLDYRGAYPNHMETRLEERGFHFAPPSYNLFCVSTDAVEFERFQAQTYVDPFGEGAWQNPINYSASVTRWISLVASLDQGVSRNDNPFNLGIFAASSNATGPKKKIQGEDFDVSGANALFFFLTHLEPVLSFKDVVIPFDNRVYQDYSRDIGQGINPDSDRFVKYLQEYRVD